MLLLCVCVFSFFMIYSLSCQGVSYTDNVFLTLLQLTEQLRSLIRFYFVLEDSISHDCCYITTV